MWVKNRDTVIDWGEILYGTDLPRGIRPCDIDGIIEINNYFLGMECKNLGEQTKRGQEMLLERLANVPKFTVIRITRGPDGIEEIYNYKSKKVTATDPIRFQFLIERWARQADASSF